MSDVLGSKLKTVMAYIMQTERNQRENTFKRTKTSKKLRMWHNYKNVS